MRTSTKKTDQPQPRDLYRTRAYDELRSRFSRNEYAPGAYLSERQLAAELGMSKTPIKAALARLEMEGFIDVSPQTGIFVRDLTDKEIADLYEIRIALEGYALRTIAGNLSDSQLKVWETNVNALAKCTGTPRSRRKAVALDTEFHLLPMQFLGNQQIVDTMQQYSERIQIVIHRVFALLPDRISQSVEEHREILQAVRKGEGAKASILVEAHLKLGHKMLIEARLQ